MPIIYDLTSPTTLVGLANGVTIFTITLNPANGTYTVDMDGKIDSTQTIDFNGGGYNFTGGNFDWNGFVKIGEELGGTVTDNNSQDLLLTPAVNGANDSTVNTTANTGGIGGGASVGSGETFRIDFVTDLRGNQQSTGGGDYDTASKRDHVYDGHYTVNGASALFKSTTGSVVNIQAFDDPDGNNVVGDGNPDTINGVSIIYRGVQLLGPSGEQIIIPTTTPTNYSVSGHVFTITLLADGSVNVAGVEGDPGSSLVGTQIAVFTATGYNSVEYSWAGGADFQIGDFGATTLTTSPVVFTVPVQVVDGDGDVSANANIQITALTPAAPIVLDLDGDGAEFLSTAAGVAFDYAGDGNPESTAWVGADDGLLAIDSNGNGLVDNGSEIVFGGNGLTDLQGLAANYDSNKDGVLDANDADFAKFGVWQDANSNGVTDAGEFRSLTDAGITSINLVSDGVEYAAANGEVTVHGTSSYTKADGTTGDVADASFATAGESKVAANENDQRVLASANTGMASSLVAAGLVAAIAGASESANNQLEQLGGSDFAVRTVAEDMASDTQFDAPDHNALFNSDSGSSSFEGADLIDTAKFSSYDQVEDHADGDFGGFGEMDSSSLLSDLLASTEIEHANFAQTGFAIGSHVDAASEALIAIQQGDMFAKAAIEEVVADALAGGFGEGANVDALLNALAGPANDTLLLGDTLAQQFGDHPAFEALNFAAANDMLDQLASTHMELSAATGQHG